MHYCPQKQRHCGGGGAGTVRTMREGCTLEYVILWGIFSHALSLCLCVMHMRYVPTAVLHLNCTSNIAPKHCTQILIRCADFAVQSAIQLFSSYIDVICMWNMASFDMCIPRRSLMQTLQNKGRVPKKTLYFLWSFAKPPLGPPGMVFLRIKRYYPYFFFRK